jgi:4-diphosphocytidyl-2-C-methyl-D-erythritol kinase
VFKALAEMRAKDGQKDYPPCTASAQLDGKTSMSADALIEAVANSGNDLEAPAIAVQPIVADVIKALRELPGCRLARMSGSGATCFALFDRAEAALAAKTLRAKQPGWWVKATVLGEG